jgi:hypothetical protein
MAVTVKEMTLWRRESDNRPGALAEAIEPLAGIDLRVLMGYRYTGNPSKGDIEVSTRSEPKKRSRRRNPRAWPSRAFLR